MIQGIFFGIMGTKPVTFKLGTIRIYKYVPTIKRPQERVMSTAWFNALPRDLCSELGPVTRVLEAV